MESLRKGLNKILNAMTGICFLAMVVFTFAQVVMRYVFNSPLTWSDELVSYLFAWASLLGACLVTGERGHMNIPLLGQSLSNEGAKKVLGIFCEMVAFVFSTVILVYGGVQVYSLSMGQMTSSLGVTAATFYIMLPVAGIVNALYAVLNIHDIVKGRIQAFPED